MALTTIDDRGLKTPIDLIDNEKIRLGTGNDLEVYHNGTDSFIKSNTNKLRLLSDKFRFNNLANDETFIYAENGAQVQLYYDGVKKFETLSGGAHVTGLLSASGNINITDSGKFQAGDSQDLQIYHDGSHNYCDIADGQVLYFRHNSANKFYVQSGGAQFVGSLYGDDDNKIELGSGQDLKIYHNGTNSVISETTGHLRLQTSTANKNIVFEHASDGDYYAIFYQDGACELYYDNSKKIETLSGGVKVHGTLIVAGDDVRDDNYKSKWGTGDDLQIYHDGTINRIRSNVQTVIEKTDSEDLATFIPDGAVSLFYDGSKKFETYENGIILTGTATNCGNVFRTSDNTTRGYVWAEDGNEIGFLTSSGGWRLKVEDDGDYVFSGSNISDRDRKDNITTVTGTSLDKITKLVPKTFNWKATDDGRTLTDRTFTGFIAQEVKEHLPSLVNGTDGQKNMSVDYNGLLAHAVKAITELSTEVETLKTKVATLEAK